MTRLELSLTHGAFLRFRPNGPSVKTKFHKRVKAAFAELVSSVMNDQQTLDLVYRRLSVPTLIGSISRSKVNMMIIGQSNSWIVNARTSHPNFFVGSRLAIGISSKASSQTAWRKLEVFALRFAAPGSTIKVYCPDPNSTSLQLVGEFYKCSDALFQAPGCSLPNLNGIKLPAHM